MTRGELCHNAVLIDSGSLGRTVDQVNGAVAPGVQAFMGIVKCAPPFTEPQPDRKRQLSLHRVCWATRSFLITIRIANMSATM